MKHVPESILFLGAKSPAILIFRNNHAVTDKVEVVELYAAILPAAFTIETDGYELIVIPGSKIKASPTVGGVVKLTVSVVGVNWAKLTLSEGFEDNA